VPLWVSRAKVHGSDFLEPARPTTSSGWGQPRLKSNGGSRAALPPTAKGTGVTTGAPRSPKVNNADQRSPRCAHGPREAVGDHARPCARAANSGAGCPFDALARRQPRRSPRSRAPPRVRLGSPLPSSVQLETQDHRAARRMLSGSATRHRSVTMVSLRARRKSTGPLAQNDPHPVFQDCQ
jgi:hypothetical protein